ncbi:acyl-CoA dehydrogenase NM domain-like protein [Cenococcum geophilum 1.58]|uniref:acyl-CoA dehydrogenase NM domain-like protein n=1 Tax=Cenococcum geophilum 1.58 TaxID=794803 RepID=UPI00359019B4|nr:acyl-CoA dehydrogenase NM domain-like protein [Cenococcum geophilum 1.58]
MTTTPYGSTIPWAEPSWLGDYVRKWSEEHFAGKTEEWEAAGKIPDEVYQECAKTGLLVPIAAGKIKAEEWDGFHDFVLWDELTVGAPPLRAFASPALQAKVIPEILSGQKKICLAVTEPSCGSDVRNLTTAAERHPMTAVRTGGPGAQGISMILIPRLPGLKTRPISAGAGRLSSTTYVTFEDVKVPAEYLIGAEGAGFRQTMVNFNHERLWIAQKRKAFGQRLIDQPVVRYKFGNMAWQVEALQAWTEQVVYELEHLSAADGVRLLGGVAALLKVEGGIVGKYVANECVKIMGGTGQGARVEPFFRSTPKLIVPAVSDSLMGGPEDVLIDLGVREALKLSRQAEKAKVKL